MWERTENSPLVWRYTPLTLLVSLRTVKIDTAEAEISPLLLHTLFSILVQLSHWVTSLEVICPITRSFLWSRERLFQYIFHTCSRTPVNTPYTSKQSYSRNGYVQRSHTTIINETFIPLITVFMPVTIMSVTPSKLTTFKKNPQTCTRHGTKHDLEQPASDITVCWDLSGFSSAHTLFLLPEPLWLHCACNNDNPKLHSHGTW